MSFCVCNHRQWSHNKLATTPETYGNCTACSCVGFAPKSGADLTEPQQAALAGAIFYTLPEEVLVEQIDPLLRDAVMRINASGWLWTAESCQGHPDCTDSLAWAGNVKPMLRLVCRTEHLGRAMALLTRSATYVGDELLPTAVGFEVWPRCLTQPEWSEVLVYMNIHARTVYDRNLGVEVWNRFAELVAQTAKTPPDVSL